VLKTKLLAAGLDGGFQGVEVGSDLVVQKKPCLRLMGHRLHLAPVGDDFWKLAAPLKSLPSAAMSWCHPNLPYQSKVRWSIGDSGVSRL
jgi:hypothetical protein